MAHLLKKFAQKAVAGREVVASEKMERQIEMMQEARLTRLTHTLKNLSNGWSDELDRDVEFIRQTGFARSALKTARKFESKIERAAPGTVRRVTRLDGLEFQVGVRFLRECADYLLGDPQGRERIILVSGVVTPDGVRVLSTLEKVKFDEQTATFVSANQADLQRKLIELDRDGHPWLGMWHSHPFGTGIGGSAPSQTDMDMQNRFVAAGCDTIGGIFTRDYTVRIFGTGKPLKVHVFGEGFTTLSESSHELILKLEKA